MVPSTSRKSRFLPRARRRAKAKAAKLHEIRLPTMLLTVMISELARKVLKGRQSFQPATKFPQSRGSGIHFGGKRKICLGSLSAVESIQSRGMVKRMAPGTARA